ncbi:MAG: aminotransferase class I/II-fold pyridoxal phosphate-dependent enzyme [Lachnospiraceae bacterium]|nr:aminotransferase class I/II-fold pyridoxal phosphate-dependent enzyme [Lachnospiraceae bacterium]
MISFENDYSEGAHPAILRRLTETNFEQVPGYGNDPYSAHAKELIRAACGTPEADVTFIGGGTQTNLIVIASLLKNYEGVIAPSTGHIGVHEAGAIECTGHKVLSLPGYCGKLDADDMKKYLAAFYGDESHTHMVFPGMVYLSFPTEYGTLYTKKELTEISAVCREYGMKLFVDGARLGYGLMSEANDVSLSELASFADVFYIGGTKVGALIGEAVVFPKGDQPVNFITTVKQHGGLLAKGRLTGIQFEALFTDGLYFEIAKNAMEKAKRLKSILAAKGWRFFLDSPTNQQFVVIDDETLKRVREKFVVSFWEKPDPTHTVVRFATSWATTDAMLDALEAFQ